MDPSFNLDRRTLENGFSQPTRMDIQVRLAVPYHLDAFSTLKYPVSALGFVPIAINRPLNPIFRTPKNQNYTLSGRTFSLAATSSPTSLGQALDKPLSHGVIHQKARRQTRDKGTQNLCTADPFPGPPKIQKSIPPSFSLPALETSPRNHKRGTARGIGVDTRPVSRSSENRKIHRAILKTHSRASSFGKAARLNEGYGNGLGDNETSQG
ncbi:hypothetical protein D9611_011389 [Ephemerocybe angulata]|uniref:Uncharacterized protein n=1 Tax=Ephemerocybe angulata TaxID=980116 RepID=A0A8H5BBN8_9AGAR|nr:hypothetical protein D9611_011389 [Tulosesus angulatus]